MNVLVTGGCGLIGSNLVKELKKSGNNVISIDMKPGADYILDISNDDLSIISEDIDVIYHLAAQPYGKGSELDPIMDMDYNVKGTLKICLFAKEKKISKIIYTSTMAVYGDNNFAKETDKLNPLSNYAVSKLTGEFYIKKFANQLNIPYIIFRVWNTYGPGQDLSNEFKGVVSAFCMQVLKGTNIKVTGSLDRYRDLMYVDDVVNALILSKEWNNSDVYNISSGIKITIKELIHSIIKSNNKNILDFSIVNIGSHDGDQFGCVGDNSKLRSMGWSISTNLEDGLRKFLNYIKDESR